MYEANLKLKAKKSIFFCKEVSFLGHIVSLKGIKTDPAETKAVDDWKRPTKKSELRSFLGLVSYHRKLFKEFAKIAKCIHALTSKHGNQLYNVYFYEKAILKRIILKRAKIQT